MTVVGELLRRCFREVVRNGGRETHRLFSSRVNKTQFPGVKHLARKISSALAAVKFVPEHGMTDVVKMDADLVGPPAVDRAFHEADVAG